jgi:phosphoribosylanthranilate isomerase
MNRPQIKICGLKRPDEAIRCVEAGANAVGLVFFEKSPRNVSDEQARYVVAELPPTVVPTGVFVNESFDVIMSRVDRCGLRAVQLHGDESPDLVDRLVKESLIVIKVLYLYSNPSIVIAHRYNPTAFLVEASKGALPGGNALAWDVRKLTSFTDKPVLIAGGLSSDNICDAIRIAHPDGVDVSSGVERKPGVKDLDKIDAFTHAVNTCGENYTPRRIF